MYDGRNKNLSSEVIRISGATPDMDRGISLKVILKTPKHTFHLQDTVSIDIESDFKDTFTDVLTVYSRMPKGDFYKLVLPHRERLTAVISIYKIGGNVTGVFNVKLDFTDWEEKELFVEYTLEDLNKEYIEFGFEAIDPDIHKLKYRSISGIYKKATVEEVIKSVYGIKDFKIFGFTVPSDIIRMSKPNNDRTYKHIVLNNVKLLGVPDYLQEKYGIYNGDVNVYKRVFNTTNLFIYPLYRVNHFVDDRPTLQIIAVTDSIVKTLSATYIMEGTIMKILVQRPKKYNDDERALKNKGARVKAIESDSIMTRSFEVTPVSLKVNSKNAVHKTQHKETEHEGTPIIDGGITNNHYRLRSRVLSSDGYYIRVEWNNSNSLWLTPDTDVTYVEEDQGVVKTRKGVIHKLHTIFDADKRVEYTVLFIFVRHTKEPDKPKVFKIF